MIWNLEFHLENVWPDFYMVNGRAKLAVKNNPRFTYNILIDFYFHLVFHFGFFRMRFSRIDHCDNIWYDTNWQMHAKLLSKLFNENFWSVIPIKIVFKLVCLPWKKHILFFSSRDIQSLLDKNLSSCCYCLFEMPLFLLSFTFLIFFLAFCSLYFS